jgi:hypothetical protein
MSTETARKIEFLPATNEDERPALRIPVAGDRAPDNALVFAYVDADGTLRVTVDTEDCNVFLNVKINVNDGTVYEGVD